MSVTDPTLVEYIFVLGRAGCGKSAATRHMATHLPQQWEIERITDYKLLHDKFRNGDPRFRPSKMDGFDVIEFSVLDEVLDEVQQQAKRAFEYRSATQNTLVTIEFARDNYQQALRLFDRDFLKNSYFLFIDAELETCIQRVHQRINPQPTPLNALGVSDDHLNNHFVSDTILRTYYKSSHHNRDYMHNNFLHDFSIDSQRIQFIDNNGGQEKFTNQVDGFLKKIIREPAIIEQYVFIETTAGTNTIISEKSNPLAPCKLVR